MRLRATDAVYYPARQVPTTGTAGHPVAGYRDVAVGVASLGLEASVARELIISIYIYIYRTPSGATPAMRHGTGPAARRIHIIAIYTDSN